MEKNNKEFSVGDGVHWTGWTDSSPGTVIEVKPSRVTVARCDLHLTEARKARLREQGIGEYRFSDGDDGVSFTQTDNKVVFTKRKDGTFREVGSKTVLFHVRSYYRDPSF